MNDECIFCRDGNDRRILENEYAFAVFDSYPVSKGHMLIVPRRHFQSYFDCTPEERDAVWTLVGEAKLHLDELYEPGGYNVGINVGATAGQSVMHLHVHLMPRYAGDVPDPRGGVRGVIPEKQKYQRKELQGQFT